MLQSSWNTETIDLDEVIEDYCEYGKNNINDLNLLANAASSNSDKKTSVSSSSLGIYGASSLHWNHNPTLKRYCKARHALGASLEKSPTNKNCSWNTKDLSTLLDAAINTGIQSAK